MWDSSTFPLPDAATLELRPEGLPAGPVWGVRGCKGQRAAQKYRSPSGSFVGGHKSSSHAVVLECLCLTLTGMRFPVFGGAKLFPRDYPRKLELAQEKAF